MDKTGQQRYREKMKQDGKQQRVFYLSSAAIVELKNKKSAMQKASLNEVIESLIFNSPAQSSAQQSTPNIVEVEKIVELEKIVYRDVEKTIFKPSFEQQKILEQAGEIAKLYQLWKMKPDSNVAGKNLTDSCRKLAELM
ncbi:MAG: hypothetical protein Q8K61_08800 [Gallionella sp.]|nr:hypothetical protein [Gallionella sp.]